MNSPKKNLDFIPSAHDNFEHRNDARDLLEAGRQFAAVIDDEMLSNPGEVRSSKTYYFGMAVDTSKLFKKSEVSQADGSWLRVGLYSEYIESLDHTEKRIVLQEIDADGKDRAMYSYVCDRNLVKRTDTHNVQEGLQNELLFAEAMTDEARVANEAFEKSMGENYQPVGTEEVLQLQELIGQAEIYNGGRNPN